jgi:hypothetical protein
LSTWFTPDFLVDLVVVVVVVVAGVGDVGVGGGSYVKVHGQFRMGGRFLKKRSLLTDERDWSTLKFRSVLHTTSCVVTSAGCIFDNNSSN